VREGIDDRVVQVPRQDVNICHQVAYFTPQALLAPGSHVAQVMEPSEPFREELQDALVRTRRQAILIERLGTELHGLLLVLFEKKILTLAEVRAAERRLDLAATIARAKEFETIAEDVDRLDAELDDEAA